MTVEAADVVISGAGPNGLMLACELALAGVRPVVLDKLPGPSDEPKANGLVGQVIRQLDMRGLYHTFGGDERTAEARVRLDVRGLVAELPRDRGQPDVRAAHPAAAGGPAAGEAGA